MEVSGRINVPAALPPRKGSGTHGTQGWLGPRITLVTSKSRESLAPPGARNTIPRTPSL
jgi:hypothetical protein